MLPHARNKRAARAGRWITHRYCRVSRRYRVNASYAQQTLGAQRRFFCEAPGSWRFRKFTGIERMPRVAGALAAFVMFFVRLWNEFEAAGFRVKRGMTIIIAKLLTKTMSPQKFSAPDEVGRTLWASALFVRGRNGAQCTNASYIALFFQRGTGFMTFSHIYGNEAKAARGWCVRGLRLVFMSL